MKYLLLLFPFVSFAQCPEDLWKRAILIGDEPMEVQIGEGQHMVLIVFERKDASKVQTWVISQKGSKPPEPVTEKIDAEKATFAGTWVHGPTPAVGWYDGTIAFSNQPGSSVSYTFTGRGIELWSERKPTHGSGVITLSQGTNVIETKPVTFTGSDALPVKVYERTLPLGTYTIKLTVGTGYNLVDFYQVTK